MRWLRSSASTTGGGSSPWPWSAGWGRWACSGCRSPRSTAGWAATTVALCVAIEELARVDSSVAITLEAGVSLGAMPILRFGTEEQRATWLPRLAAGEMLGAFGLTESGSGSDAGSVRTTAVVDGEEWVINGSKSFITNSGTAITGLVTVTAVTGTRADGRPEISTIIVPAGTPGFDGGPGVRQGRLERLGHPRADASPTCASRWPTSSGIRGRGYAQFLSILDEGRDRDRRAGDRAGPGLRGRVAGVRRDPGVVRPADRRPAGDPVQDRRHGGPRPPVAPGLAARRRPHARRPAVHARGQPSPSCTRRRRRWTTPGMPPRSTAATGS